MEALAATELFRVLRNRCCERMCEDAGVPPTTDEGPGTDREYGPLIKFFPEYNNRVIGHASYKKEECIGCCPDAVK